MSTYREVRKKTAEVMAGDDPQLEPMPCRFCGGTTTRATLAVLGARCQPCFTQYLAKGYSGAEPPKQFAQAAWVAEAARSVRHVPNAFGALAERLKAQRPSIKGLDDDSVNAMLQAGA